MKKLLVVLSILTIALAGSAFAQDAPSDNNVGIYLADGAHNADAIPGSMLDLHLVISNLTADTVSGFELKLETSGPVFIAESTIVYPTQVINVGVRVGEFIVGFDGPVPAVDGAVEVMSFSVFVTDDAVSGGLFIKPIFFPSIASVPSYLIDADSGELVEMRQSTGGADDAVFVINSQEVPVATESTSFDNLKSLYR